MNREQVQAARQSATAARENNKAGKKNKGKKSGSLGVWVLIILGYVGYSLWNNPSFQQQIRPLRRQFWQFWFRLSLRTGIDFQTLPKLAAAALVLLIVLIVVLASAAKKGITRAEREDPVPGRVSAAVRRADPRSTSFTKPEAYCAVHDHSGEDHLAYDKAQRLAQLDEWLKIGLIERDEYRVLKDRYQRDL